MFFRFWTNDTRRDEDKKRSPRAESTAARYECQKPSQQAFRTRARQELVSQP